VKQPALLGLAGAALLLVGFCAGRGSRAANDQAAKAWLDSAEIRDRTFRILADAATKATMRGDSIAAAARRPVVVVRTVLQPQLDTATTEKDSLPILVAQRDSLLESVGRWAQAFAAVTAARDLERTRADGLQRELARGTQLLKKARGSRCGIQVGPGVGWNGAGVRAELLQLQVGCRFR
jgi:hypothetical protein